MQQVTVFLRHRPWTSEISGQRSGSPRRRPRRDENTLGCGVGGAVLQWRRQERTGRGGVTLGREEAVGMGGASAGKELDEDVEGKMRRTDYGLTARYERYQISLGPYRFTA